MRGLDSAMASTEMSSPVCESVAPFDLEGGLEVEQVEDRAPGAALAGRHVADVAAGDVNRHDGGGAVVGFLRALDRGVEVVDELLGFGLLAEDLAESVT